MRRVTRTNSTVGLETDGGLARNHRAAVFVAALVASAACFSLVPGDTLGGSLVQGAALAVLALAAVGASNPRALRAPRLGSAGSLGPWAGYVAAIGLAAGVASFFALPQGAVLDVAPLHVAQVVALCLVTGVFEEGVFRVLALDALVPALGGSRRGMLRAALVSAVLFGALHVSLGEAVVAVDVVSGLQAVLKPVQAGLFGLFMAMVYFKTRNLWTLVGVHAAFNLFYSAPPLLAGDVQQTYVTGNPFDLVLLAATTLLLVPPALAAVRSVRDSTTP